MSGTDGCSASIDSGSAIASGAALAASAGSHTIVATATGADGQTTSVSHAYTVNKADQSISFPAVGPFTFGDAPVTLSASATSGGVVSFTMSSGSCSLNGATLTLSGAGSCVVKADPEFQGKALHQRRR